MSTTKGKRYEREVARKLRDLDWTVERVAGSGGFSGTVDCDLVMLEPGHPPADDVPLTEHADVVRAEVKYRSEAYATIYDAHADLVGLDLPAPLRWSGGVCTAGLEAWTKATTSDLPAHSHEDDCPKGVRSLLDGKSGRGGPDVAFCRAARSAWFAVWIVDGTVVRDETRQLSIAEMVK
jgi:hypothetical protein